MEGVEKSSHTRKFGWASREGAVGNVAKFQMLAWSQGSKKRGPQDSLNGSLWEVTPQSSPQDAKVSLGSSKTRVVKSYPYGLLSIAFMFFLSQSLPQALATARIQRQAEGFQCWRGGWGEKVLMLCVLGRESLTLGIWSKPPLPDEVEGGRS
jgi:hypothetical protein